MTERDKHLYHQEGPLRGTRKDERVVRVGRTSEPNLQNIPVRTELGSQLKEALYGASERHLQAVDTRADELLHSINAQGLCRSGCSQRGTGTCVLQSSTSSRPRKGTHMETAERIVEAVKALPLAVWVPCTERLPTCSRKAWSIGVEVLVWPRTVVGLAFYGRRVTAEPAFYIYGAVLTNVTHWMLLPEGPK